MLATALRRNRGNGTFDQFQQRLLYALARDITSDGGVVRLARDLVDLVDVDNAHLGLLDIVIALLQQFLNDVLDVFTHVTGFGQGGGIGNGKGYIQQTSQSFGQQRLTGTSRTDQQDVALAQLDFVFALTLIKALVVVINRYGQHLLGTLLTNHVLVKDRADFYRCRQLLLAAFSLAFLYFFANDVVAQVNALIADKHGGAGNQLAHFMLALAAEGAIQQLAVVVTLPSHIGHRKPLLLNRSCNKDGGNMPTLQVRPDQTCTGGIWPRRVARQRPVTRLFRSLWPYSALVRDSSTLSIRPYSTASVPLMKRSRSVSRAITSSGWPV